MDHIRRNRHRRREWAAAEEEGSSSSRAKHYRLNPVHNTSCESALPLPSFASEGTENTGAGSPYLHHTQTAMPSNVLDAMRVCLSRERGSAEFSTALYAMIARRAPLSSVTLQETLHHCSRQITQFDLEDLFRLVQSAERSRLGTNLCDNIETTRLLIEDAICNRVLVNLLLIKAKDLESQLHALRQICTKHTVGISESSSTTSFSHDNLKRIHIIKHGPPFKELNLNELLAGCAPPDRVKHKTALINNDFLRVFFKQACGPDSSDIWNFAYRTSNITRKKDLQDLPEAIVKTLNDFMLDALDLGIEGLQGYRLDAIKSSRSSYWISLGKCEEEREKRFDFLLERKTVYCSQIRICIAEALEDIRYYLFYQGKLVPPKKYKTLQVGFGREDKSRMTKLEWRRQALHMKEI